MRGGAAAIHRNRTGLAASPGKKRVFEHDSGRRSINPLKARFAASISRSAGRPSVKARAGAAGHPAGAETSSPEAAPPRPGALPYAEVKEGAVLSSAPAWQVGFAEAEWGAPRAGQCPPTRPTVAANHRLGRHPRRAKRRPAHLPRLLGFLPQGLSSTGRRRPGGWPEHWRGRGEVAPHLLLEDDSKPPGGLEFGFPLSPKRIRQTAEPGAGGSSWRGRTGI